MKNVKAKLKQQGGFTLIEMLLVVAIIAILVVVSIPVINTNLEDARHAADQANERAAKTLALMAYMGEIDPLSISEDPVSPYTPGEPIIADYDYYGNFVGLYYDADKGILTRTMPEKGYGKCLCGKMDEYGNHDGMVIVVQVDENGVFTPRWVPNALMDEGGI